MAETSFLELRTGAVFDALVEDAKESLDCWGLELDFFEEEGGLNPGAKGVSLGMIVVENSGWGCFNWRDLKFVVQLWSTAGHWRGAQCGFLGRRVNWGSSLFDRARLGLFNLPVERDDGKNGERRFC